MAIKQINLIPQSYIGTDYRSSLGYPWQDLKAGIPGDDRVMAPGGYDALVRSIKAELTAVHGQIAVADEPCASAEGVLVARISSMWCGGGTLYVYAQAQPAVAVESDLVAQRQALTSALADCERGAFPGSAAYQAESRALAALASFDARHPDVLRAIRSHRVEPQTSNPCNLEE